MIDLKDIVARLAVRFSEERLRFALIGGLALHAAGHSRSTGDVDFLIHADDAAKAKGIVFALGYKVIHESDDVLQMASPLGLIGGVDFLKARRHYSLAMLDRAKSFVLDGQITVPAVSVEDLIGLKLQAMNNDPARTAQDKSDIEWLLKRHAGALDMALLREYFGLFSLSLELDQMLLRIKDAK